MEQDMFAKDPAFKFRDSKGRFATAEKAMTDKALRDNNILRYNVEKYKRMYFAAVSLSSRYHRELLELKSKLNELLRHHDNK